jgi:CO/xanthine dehydrogenase FAD-binding subunit
MAEKHSTIQAYVPTQLQTLLSLFQKNPNASLLAGGTYHLPFSGNVIYLKKIDEMIRITRTERFLDIGAAASINSILSITKRVLPGPLSEVLMNIGTPAIRNMATLGGHLCIAARRMDAVPMLMLMDVRLELRTIKNTRWINLTRFYSDEGKPALQPGEILCRIRIPLEEWNAHTYKRMGAYPAEGGNLLSFYGLARIQRMVLSECRTALSFGGTDILRNREIEAQLSGRKLPLSDKGITPPLQTFRESLEELKWISPYCAARAFKLFRWFLENLGTD